MVVKYQVLSLALIILTVSVLESAFAWAIPSGMIGK